MSIIAIFGGVYCHGQDVAEKLGKELGYQLVGSEVIDWAAQEFDISRDRLIRAIERPASVFNRFTREKEKNIAYLKLAMAEQLRRDSFVYEGFLGHLVPDIGHVLKVCLVADLDHRIATAMKRPGISRSAATAEIKRDDERRLNWTRYLFDTGPWERSLYDIKLPMHEKTVDEAVAFIAANIDEDVIRTTLASVRQVEDFVLAARVNVTLVENGHDVRVTANDGNVTLVVERAGSRPKSFESALKELVGGLEGVKGVTIELAPNYRESNINPFYNIDVEMPAKVLLVDDEKEFVQTLSERLQMRQMGSAVALNGEEALAIVKEDEPEVMVLDLSMPGIDGIEVLRRIKKSNPLVEVIILTGHGTDRDEKLSRELGAFAYLHKPTDISKLAETIKAAYAKLRMQDDLQ